MPFSSGKCKSKARLDGKTAVITGCNTGIGKVTVQDFVKRGCRVIMACRDIEKAEEAAKDVRKKLEGVKDIGVMIVMRLDLNSFASVRQFSAELLKKEKHINLLINNAGVMMCPKGKTEDGFETQFGINHLGHFLLTLLLLPRIRNSTPARIVTVSSLGHEQGEINFDDLNYEKRTFNTRLAYAQSKLANVLFSAELARQLKTAKIEGINTYSVHPGLVATDLARHLDTAYNGGVKWMWNNVASHAIKTPLQGAQTTIYCAVDEKAASETGLYYSDCKVKKPSARARDVVVAQRLWDESLKMTGLLDFDPFTVETKQTVVQGAETKQGNEGSAQYPIQSELLPSNIVMPAVIVAQKKDQSKMSDLEIMGIETLVPSQSSVPEKMEKKEAPIPVLADKSVVPENKEVKEATIPDITVKDTSVLPDNKEFKDTPASVTPEAVAVPEVKPRMVQTSAEIKETTVIDHTTPVTETAAVPEAKPRMVTNE